MRTAFYLTAAALAWTIGSPAAAAEPKCTRASAGSTTSNDSNSSVTAQTAGMGVKVVKTCLAGATQGFEHTDAYYLVATTVETAPGFANNATFGKDSQQAKALKALLKAAFNYEKATSVDIGLRIEVNGVQYPITSLLYFELKDKNNWTSYVRANPQSLQHKLSAGDLFKVELSYRYSRSTNIELQPAADIVTALGANLATPAILPVISVANQVTSKLMQANGISAKSGYEKLMGPGLNQTAEIEFEIRDPQKNTLIATVNVKIMGTRSLLSTPQTLGLLESTQPTGAVGLGGLNQLPKQMATGQAKSWPLLNNALASSSSLSDIPIGKTPDGSDLLAFCNSTQVGLGESFLLTSFDSLVVRARLLEAATVNVRPRLNPYKACFNQAERNIIKAALPAIDPDFDPPAPPVQSKPLSNYEDFATIGCYLTAKEGSFCGASSDAKISALLADQVEIVALEVDQDLAAGIPPSGLITRSDFLSRFKGKFARFRDINSVPSTMIVHEKDDSRALRLMGQVDATGKLVRIAIRRAG